MAENIVRIGDGGNVSSSGGSERRSLRDRSARHLRHLKARFTRLDQSHSPSPRTLRRDAMTPTRATSLINALGLLILITCVGVVGYMIVSDMSFVDALYLTAITLSTVGSREVAPLTPGAQLFTVGLIFIGLGVVLYSASLVAGDVIEGRLQRVFGRRRVERQIEHLAEHYIVCGFGRMGRVVSKELAARPVPFVVVDRDPEALERAEGEGYLSLGGDATEDRVLVQAGIARARGLVSALSRDEDNVYVVLSARQLNPNLLIVARAEDERSESKLMHAGATRVVSPYVLGGSRMANALLRPAVLDVIDLATHYRGIELKIEELAVTTGTVMIGKTLGQSGVCEELGLIVIAIKKSDGEMLYNPAANVRIDADDRLVVMGQTASLHELEKRLGQDHA
ncbi:MAG: potassium channel protein [bacterium]